MSLVIDGVLVAMPPPPGYVVDFQNPQRNSVTTAYIVSGFGMLLSSFFAFQRLYVKTVIRKKLGVDDALLVIAWLTVVALQGLLLDAYRQGYMGIHGWEMSFEKFQLFAYMSGYISSTIYTIPTTLSKIVILMFLLEVNAVQKWYRLSIYLAMIFVSGAGIGIFFSSLFGCWPVRKSYDLAFPADEGICIDRPAMYQATAALGCITDIIIISIPIPMLLSLQMSWRKKVGLFFLFAIGSATVITSVIRLVLLIQILTNVDQPWGAGYVTIWILVEGNLLIMCACLSTLRHFFRHVAPSFLSSRRTKADSNINKHGGADGSLQLPTIGQISSHGNKRNNQFLRLDGREVETQVYAGRLSTDDKRSDEHSDRGILQTKTTQITYNTKPPH